MEKGYYMLDVHNVNNRRRNDFFGYHGGDRAWLNHHVDFTKDVIGLEIEVEIKRAFTRSTVVNEACSFGRILAEYDGSLSNERGAEFIFRAVQLEDIVDPEGFISKWSQYMRDKCKTWRQRHCGMHVSVNARNMTNLHTGKFCHFINSNHDLSIKLAGRDLGNYLKDYNNTTSEYFKNLIRNKDYPSRHFPAGKDGTRIEVRIFQSSSNFDRIKKNCEFVDAVKRWTKDERMVDMTTKNFIEFVYDNSERYATLSNTLYKSKSIQKLCSV